MSKTAFERFVGETVQGGGAFDLAEGSKEHTRVPGTAYWPDPVSHNEFSTGFRTLPEDPTEESGGEQTAILPGLKKDIRIMDPKPIAQPLFETVTPGGKVSRKGSQTTDRGAANFSGGGADIEPAALPRSNPDCRCYACEARRQAREGKSTITGNKLRWEVR